MIQPFSLTLGGVSSLAMAVRVSRKRNRLAGRRRESTNSEVFLQSGLVGLMMDPQIDTIPQEVLRCFRCQKRTRGRRHGPRGAIRHDWRGSLEICRDTAPATSQEQEAPQFITPS